VVDLIGESVNMKGILTDRKCQKDLPGYIHFVSLSVFWLRKPSL